MVSVMTSVDRIRTYLSTKKILKQDEHGVTLLLYYLHVKCALHLSRIFARKRMPISGDMTCIRMSMYGGMWMNGLTIDGVERDSTVLRRRMKKREDAIGWNSTGIEGRVMFTPYDEYQFHI